MQNVDVLIVGGGPTGMTLALELAVQKIPFRIINKATERSPYSRALVVQSRTLELLNRHGNVRKLQATGFVADKTYICVNGKVAAEVPLSLVEASGTAFPYPLSISQCETEAWLEGVLAEYGFTVEMGVEAKEIVQDEDGVTVHLAAQGRPEEVIRAKYVVGADGAHSSVRHASKNITFEGAAYPQEFILADTHIKSQWPTGKAFMCLGKGVMVVLPLKGGMVRLVVSRPGQGQAQGGRGEQPKLEEFEEFMQGVFPGGGTLHDPTWITRFHLHHRGVNSYRDGHLLLAGDAAHIHSPAGGQGMNTGIGDAVNLGWKLAAVTRGEQPDSFLDSYDRERQPVGRHLLQTSDRNFTYVATTSPIVVFLRNLVLPWVVGWCHGIMTRQFAFISQLRIRYRRSDIVGTAPGFTGPVRGGNRAVDGRIGRPDGGDVGVDDKNKSDGKKAEMWLQDLMTPESHHLFLFSGNASALAASEGDLHRAEAKFLEDDNGPAGTKVHAIFGEAHAGWGQSGYADLDGALHRAYGFDGVPGYVLVRPDGYVAHIGPLASFDGFLEWVRL